MSHDEQPTGSSLLLAFDSDDPEFARGFEAARVWSAVRLIEHAADFMVRAENAEMMLRIAEATGRQLRITELDDEWMEAHFSAPSED